jgi:hypothetical protein
MKLFSANITVTYEWSLLSLLLYLQNNPQANMKIKHVVGLQLGHGYSLPQSFDAWAVTKKILHYPKNLFYLIAYIIFSVRKIFTSSDFIIKTSTEFRYVFLVSLLNTIFNHFIVVTCTVG